MRQHCERRARSKAVVDCQVYRHVSKYKNRLHIQPYFIRCPYTKQSCMTQDIQLFIFSNETGSAFRRYDCWTAEKKYKPKWGQVWVSMGRKLNFFSHQLAGFIIQNQCTCINQSVNIFVSSLLRNTVETSTVATFYNAYAFYRENTRQVTLSCRLMSALQRKSVHRWTTLSATWYKLYFVDDTVTNT